MATDKVKTARPTTGRASSASRSRPTTAASSGGSAIDMNSQVCLSGEKAGEEKAPKSLVVTRYTRNTEENESLLIKTTLKELITYCVFTLIITISKQKDYKNPAFFFNKKIFLSI